MLLFCYLFLFFESRMLLLNFVATTLYLYFAVFVVPRKVAVYFRSYWKQNIFRHRFGHYETVTNSNDAPLFCSVSLWCYATFIILKVFHLSDVSASKKSSLQTVLVWQIVSFILHSLFYKFLSGSFSCKSTHLSLVIVVNV